MRDNRAARSADAQRRQRRVVALTTGEASAGGNSELRVCRAHACELFAERWARGSSELTVGHPRAARHGCARRLQSLNEHGLGEERCACGAVELVLGDRALVTRRSAKALELAPPARVGR
jgi:hypothetical protein